MKRAIFLILVLTACCPQKPKQTTTLRLAFNTMPTTFDPRASGDFASSSLICLLYEGLTRCLPGDGLQPGAASSVDISPDGRIYTFHLRKSVWSDGRPVIAKDFERSWKAIVSPDFPSLCAYLMFPIKNGELCKQGKLPLSEFGVRAEGDATLIVELAEPTPYFLSLTAFPLFLPVPSHRETIALDPLVCNGPFCMKALVPNSEIHLKKNPNFWNAPAILMDGMQISIVSDETTTLRLFEKNELDWIGGPLSPLPLDAIPSLQRESQLHSTPMAASTFITFNTTIPPFDDPNLRKAFALAIDREQIIDEIALIGQIPAKECLPPSLYLEPAALTSSERHREDPEAALTYWKQALEKYGGSLSELESLTLYYKGTDADKRLAQALQRKWEKRLGLTIQIQQLDPKTHIHKLHHKEYQIALASWIAQFHDASNILERYRLPSNPKNFSGWNNEEYAYLLEKASLTLDAKERQDLLQQAEEILEDAMPVYPIYHWAALSLSHPRLLQMATTRAGGILFEQFLLNRDDSLGVIK